MDAHSCLYSLNFRLFLYISLSAGVTCTFCILTMKLIHNEYMVFITYYELVGSGYYDFFPLIWRACKNKSSLVCDVAMFLSGVVIVWCHFLFMQGHEIRKISMILYALLILTQKDLVHTFTKKVLKLISTVWTSEASGLPFSCISDSINRLTPLKLDMSLPSFQDVRWNFARLLYLFNIQLERNVAT